MRASIHARLPAPQPTHRGPRKGIANGRDAGTCEEGDPSAGSCVAVLGASTDPRWGNRHGHRDWLIGLVFDRIRTGGQGNGCTRAPALPRTCLHHQYRALHRHVAGALQGYLALISVRTADRLCALKVRASAGLVTLPLSIESAADNFSAAWSNSPGSYRPCGSSVGDICAQLYESDQPLPVLPKTFALLGCQRLRLRLGRGTYRSAQRCLNSALITLP